MVMSAAEAVPRKALWKPGEIAPDYLDGRLAGDAPAVISFSPELPASTTFYDYLQQTKTLQPTRTGPIISDSLVPAT